MAERFDNWFPEMNLTAIGSLAGAGVGGALGSVVGPLGTNIGAVVGSAVGSMLLGGATAAARGSDAMLQGLGSAFGGAAGTIAGWTIASTPWGFAGFAGGAGGAAIGMLASRFWQTSHLTAQVDIPRGDIPCVNLDEEVADFPKVLTPFKMPNLDALEADPTQYPTDKFVFPRYFITFNQKMRDIILNEWELFGTQSYSEPRYEALDAADRAYEDAATSWQDLSYTGRESLRKAKELNSMLKTLVKADMQVSSIILTVKDEQSIEALKENGRSAIVRAVQDISRDALKDPRYEQDNPNEAMWMLKYLRSAIDTCITNVNNIQTACVIKADQIKQATREMEPDRSARPS